MADDIYGVIVKHEEDVYSLATEIPFSDAENQIINRLLAEHETEGGSVCGTLYDVKEAIRANKPHNCGERRKVLVVYGKEGYQILFVTDAPKAEILNWGRRFMSEWERVNITGFDSLKAMYYVKVLHDTFIEENKALIDIIGYDEMYDLNDIVTTNEQEG